MSSIADYSEIAESEINNQKKSKKTKFFCIIFVIVFLLLVSGAIYYIKKKYDEKNYLQRSFEAYYNSYSPPGTEKPADLPKVIEAPKKTGKVIKIPILMYHYILDPATMGDPVVQNLSVSPVNLEEQIRYFVLNGYEITDLDELYTNLKNKETSNINKIVLSFDDGYDNFYTNAYPILKARNIKASVFIITDRIGTLNYLTWNQVIEMDRSGLITIGSHTLNHAYLIGADKEKATREILDSKSIIESHLGHSISYFCYPYGAFDFQAMQLVEQSGYKMALSTIQGIDQTYNDRYWLERIRVGQSYTGSSIEYKINEFRIQNQ